MQEEVMKRSAILLALALLAPAAAAATAEPRVLSIDNTTAQAADAIYLSSVAGAEDRGDLLEDQVLPPGRYAQIELEAGACVYDLDVEFVDNAELRLRNYDACAHPVVDLAAEMSRQRPRPAAPRGRPPRRASGTVSSYAMEVTADEAGEAGEVQAMDAPAPISRGIPICPGDVRCRKK
jgi:hypothetical protein